MRKNLLTAFFALTLFTLTTACSGNERPEEGYQRPKVWPKPTEPPPASPIYTDIVEPVPTEEDIAREARDHNAILESELERALLGSDAIRRETVFVHILPELLQVEPKRLVDLHARLKAGEPRETLGRELARLWASTDARAAAQWMSSLQGPERRQAAIIAVTTLAPWEPGAALRFADEFDLEQDSALRKLLSTLRRPLLDTAPN